MKKPSRKQCINFILVALFTVFFIYAFALPIWLSLPFVFFNLYLLWRKKAGELALIFLSLMIALGALEVGVRITSEKIFYREQEKWAARGRFVAHVNDTINMPHGDLVAMDPSLKETLAEPRTIEFITDSLGYRNDTEYAGEPYVLIGDSYTLGTANTQSNMLASQLNAKMGQQFYSLGYPGSPASYERNALRFLMHTKANPKFLWFIFEGNDLFPEGAKEQKLSRPTLFSELLSSISMRQLPLQAPRFMTMLFRSVDARLKNMLSHSSPNESPVSVFTLAGKQVGFLKQYINATTTQTLRFSSMGTDDVLSRTACVFFIPDKHRIYKPWLGDRTPDVTEPSAGLKEIQAYFEPKHIRVIDVTPYLSKAAEDAMAENKLIYWRDDTHWNPLGIAAAVPAIQACVQQLPDNNPLH